MGCVYRSRSNIIAGACLLVIADSLAIGAIVQAPESTSLVIISVVYAIVSTVVCVRLMLARLTILPDRIHVANIISTFDLPRSDIEKYEVGRWKLTQRTCLIHTHDGQIKPALGLQESTNFPNGSVEQVVDELNQKLSEASKP